MCSSDLVGVAGWPLVGREVAGHGSFLVVQTQCGPRTGRHHRPRIPHGSPTPGPTSVDIAVLYCYDAIYECDLACSHQGSPRRRVDRGDRHLGAARAVAPERSSLQSTACSTARAAVNHVFTSVEQLLDDFERDIANWSQTMKAIIENKTNCFILIQRNSL